MGGPHLEPFVIPCQTACFDCVRTTLNMYTPTTPSSEENADEKPVFLERGYNAIFTPLISSCIGLGVTEIVKFLTGFALPVLENGLLYLNPTRFSITHQPTPRESACTSCEAPQ